MQTLQKYVFQLFLIITFGLGFSFAPKVQAVVLEIEPTTILRSQRSGVLSWGDLVYQFPIPTNASFAYSAYLNFNGDHPFSAGQPSITDAIHTCYSFDTTIIPDSANINSVEFSFYPTYVINTANQIDLFKSVAVDHSVTDCSYQEWLPNLGKPPYVGTNRGSILLSQINNNTYNKFPTSIEVQKTSFTNVVFSIAGLITTDTFPENNSDYGNSAVITDHNTYKPKLIITYDEQLTKLGDANQDNNVDELDYDLWLSDYLNQITSTSTDFNQDLSTDGIDYAIWLTNYGK